MIGIVIVIDIKVTISTNIINVIISAAVVVIIIVDVIDVGAFSIYYVIIEITIIIDKPVIKNNRG